MTKVNGNGFDIASLDDVQQAQEDGIPVEIMHPATGEPVGITIVVAGPDSSHAKKADRVMINRRLKAQKNKTLTAEELQVEAHRKLAACTISWVGVELGGEALGCTTENVVMVYERLPFISEQVAEAAGDRAAFFTS